MTLRRFIATLAALTALTARAGENSDSAALAFLAIRDDYDAGGGAALVRDLTDTIAVYLSLERVCFEDESSYRDDFFSSKTTRDVNGYELQLGYLHRVWSRDGASLQIGPAIGFEDIDGDERNTYGGDFGEGTSSVSIDYEMGLTAYLQALLRIRAFDRVDLFASVALGYRGAREITYGDGDVIPLAETRAADTSIAPAGYSFNDDSDTFLRAALGIAIPF